MVSSPIPRGFSYITWRPELRRKERDGDLVHGLRWVALLVLAPTLPMRKRDEHCSRLLSC